jgi:CRP-like cAMP-binding protein
MEQAMAPRKFSELLSKMPEASRTRVEARVRQELLEMSLRELRQLVGKTQTDLADVLETTQGQVSTTEGREDHLLSTLRHYVAALGGELDVVARFGDKTIRLRGV